MIYQTAGGEEESRSVGVGIRVEGKSAYIHELRGRFQDITERMGVLVSNLL